MGKRLHRRHDGRDDNVGGLRPCSERWVRRATRPAGLLRVRARVTGSLHFSYSDGRGDGCARRASRSCPRAERSPARRDDDRDRAVNRRGPKTPPPPREGRGAGEDGRGAIRSTCGGADKVALYHAVVSGTLPRLLGAGAASSVRASRTATRAEPADVSWAAALPRGAGRLVHDPFGAILKTAFAAGDGVPHFDRRHRHEGVGDRHRRQERYEESRHAPASPFPLAR